MTQRDPETIFICGGINKSLDKITESFHIFNPMTRVLKSMPDMQNMRYTFPLIYNNERLYALGGRVYGNDQQSLLAECEYFDFAQKKWISIPNMNRKRCTSMAFVCLVDIGLS